MVGLGLSPASRRFDPREFYSREIHLTPLASVFTDGTHIARVFNELRALFDPGLLTPPAIKTLPLEDSAEAYQTALAGSAGIEHVLLPNGDGAQTGSR